MQKAPESALKLDPVWVKRSLIGGVLGLLGALLGWVVVGNLIR